MATNGRRPDPVERLSLKIKTLLNAHLKEILRAESLPVSGVKQELINRLQDHIQNLANDGDTQRIQRILAIAERGQAATSSSSPTAPYLPQHSYLPPSKSTSSFGPFPNMPSKPGIPTAPIRFKPSPFFTVDQTLVSNRELKIRENTRDTLDVELNLSPGVVTALNDPSTRVMVYCAGDSGLSPYTFADVAFPHQCELKCNLDDVKANLRGLKNKPGSTRPADITPFLRKKVGYLNKVSVTYALTTKQRYYLVINLVKKHSVEELVQKIRAGKYISKELVLKEMRGKAEDADIVATSSVMSLKCPLSTLRLEIPTRGMTCAHNQCFDATSFLQLQEQAPTWTCPVCNKSTPYESLAMDMYVDGILKSTERNVEQVTVEPDGTWTKNAPPETPDKSRPSAYDDDDDDDDDIVEIQDTRIASLKREQSTVSPIQHTPSYSSREPSVTLSARQPSSAPKRLASAVIDLTESDDDDLPVRPPKRPSLAPGPPSSFNTGISFPLPRPSLPPAPPRPSSGGYHPSSETNRYFNTSL